MKSSQKNTTAVRRRIFRVDWKVGEVWETLNTKKTPLQGVFLCVAGGEPASMENATSCRVFHVGVEGEGELARVGQPMPETLAKPCFRCWGGSKRKGGH